MNKEPLNINKEEAINIILSQAIKQALYDYNMPWTEGLVVRLTAVAHQHAINVLDQLSERMSK